MPRIEPHLLPALTALDRGLRELGIPYGVVGALVQECLLDAKPPRLTNDADATVVVESRADFEALKDRLAAYDFARTRQPYRLQHKTGAYVDLLPFSQNIAPEGRLELAEDLVFNMTGFDQVVPNAIPIAIEDGPTVPVTPLPLYALLKLVAFSDRKKAKDVASVMHCLQHYLESEDP